MKRHADGVELELLAQPPWYKLPILEPAVMLASGTHPKRPQKHSTGKPAPCFFTSQHYSFFLLPTYPVPPLRLQLMLRHDGLLMGISSKT